MLAVSDSLSVTSVCRTCYCLAACVIPVFNFDFGMGVSAELPNLGLIYQFNVESKHTVFQSKTYLSLKLVISVHLLYSPSQSKNKQSATIYFLDFL